VICSRHPGRAEDRVVPRKPRQPITTVNELLDGHVSYVKTLMSAPAELIHIARIKRLMGSCRLSTLERCDFEAFRDACGADGQKLTTVSRTLTTMRSALSRAVANKLVEPNQAPRIPEFSKVSHLRPAPPKGRPITLWELAQLIDAINAPHLLWFMVLLLNTGSRSGALLDLEARQIDTEFGVIELNPPGRRQTNKYRPTLPITDTLRPWLVELPPGPIITWRGRRVEAVDAGFLAACRRAKLPGGVTAWSVRYTLARYMRRREVPDDQIALWLGRRRPPNSNATILICAPDAPEYLRDAKSAVESFVHEVNALTTRDLLAPPRPR